MQTTSKLLIRRFCFGALGCISAILIGFVSHGLAMEGPEEVELDTLVNMYEGVTFDHLMHVDVASCEACHHHTLGKPPENEKCVQCHQGSDSADEVACYACHQADPIASVTQSESGEAESSFHLDTPGLKRAYHLNCMGCHREMGAPAGCEDCHPKKDNWLEKSAQ